MAITFSSFYVGFDNVVSKIIPEPTRVVIGHSALHPERLSSLQEDYIYIGNVSTLNAAPSVSRTNLILLEDEKVAPRFLESNVLNIILTSDLDLFQSLQEQVKKIFDAQMQLNNFGCKLLLFVQDGVSTQKLLDYGYQVFGNPLLLLGPSLCLLGSAGTDALIDEPVIRHVLSKGYMPKEYLEEVMKEENHSTEEDKVLIIWEKDFLKHRLIAGRIVRNDHLIGYLKLLEYNRPFSDVLEVERLKLFCQYLALSMDSPLFRHYTGHPFMESLLTDIISRKLTDKREINERVDICCLEFQAQKAVILVELEEKFKKIDRLYLLKQRLQTFLNRDTLFIFNNDIVILYDKSARNDLFDPKLLASLQALLEENNARAAFSMPFQEICDFHKYYTQALACFQIAGRLRLQKRIYLYEDYVITHMFLHFGEIFNLEEMIHPYVQKLASIDSKKESELVETLFCFILHNQDITATAKYMHDHYNTLKYRILRIQELTGIDLTDEKTIYRIHLSRQILQLQECIGDAP